MEQAEYSTLFYTQGCSKKKETCIVVPMKIFGNKFKNKRYIKRHGAYGLIIKDEKIATIQFEQGYFLPGGGVDEGEDFVDALKREALEELGWQIDAIELLGVATQFFYTSFKDKHIENIGHFFVVRKLQKVAEATEEDHALVWLTLHEAAQKLYHEHQRWAARQLFVS